MAASLMVLRSCFKPISFTSISQIRSPLLVRYVQTKSSLKLGHFVNYRHKFVGGLFLAGSVSFAVYRFAKSDISMGLMPVTNAASSPNSIPNAKPTRMVRSSTDNSGLRLTLYQYESCPFCSKVRAYLDYYGYSYDVVEVNSLKRKELQFSHYKKVPILVCSTGEDTFVQFNDSSLIVSLLQSHLNDKTLGVEKLLSFYPEIESKNSKGKTVYEYPNKYFVMLGEKASSSTTENKEKVERQWRQWTDEVLVHTLSPNIYRTPGEAMQAFRYFSDVGEWTQTFGKFEQQLIVYCGAAAMFFIGRLLKKRHHLKDDVRESMYDACRDWMQAVRANGDKFLGGDQPCLADLAVYGVLSSIEGCDAFKDLLANTDIASWYLAVTQVVKQNAGRRETSNVDDNKLMVL